MPVDSLKCIREIGVMLRALNFSLIDLYSLLPRSHNVSGISIFKIKKKKKMRDEYFSSNIASSIEEILLESQNISLAFSFNF